MKLLSFVSPHQASWGLVEGRRIVDLGARLGPTCPDLLSAVRAGDLARFERAAAGLPADYHADQIRYLPVLPNPSRIFCVGLNYLAHRVEGQHKPEASAPMIFLRLPESQVGHGEPMLCPIESFQFDYEAEMAVVIGRGGRRIARADAWSHIAGISAYNEGSVRDWQLATPPNSQWTPGKNFPATGAFGPWLVTADEAPPERARSLVCRLNGQEMQRSSTDLMIFPVPELVQHISTFATLLPGDVIVTGTPGGVGMRRSPPAWMKHGDVVEIELEGVGVLRNPVVKETA